MAAPVVTAPRNQPDVLESAGRLVDEHMQADGRQLELSAQLKIATHSELSGGVSASEIERGCMCNNQESL